MKFVVTIFCFLLLACSSDTSKSKIKNGDYYPTYTKDLEDTIRALDLQYVA